MMATMPATSPGQDVAQRLLDDGYVVVTGMMTPEQTQHARADLDRILRTTRTGRNSFEGFDTQRIYALFAKTRAFDALAIDPLLLGVLDQVLGHYRPIPSRLTSDGQARMVRWPYANGRLLPFPPRGP